MRNLATYEPRLQAQPLPWTPADHAAAQRLLALMYDEGGPLSRPFRQQTREGDRTYFRRRSGEERQAAERANGAAARDAHRNLARLYARLSDAARRRKDALLDDALDDTFPASDPVSVGFIR